MPFRSALFRPGPHAAPISAIVLLLAGGCAIGAPHPDRSPPIPEPPARADARDVESFEAAWRIIRDTHFDTTFNGTDWNALRHELLPRVLEARDRDEVRAVIHQMLQRLGQSHFGLIPGTVGRPAPEDSTPRHTDGPTSESPGRMVGTAEPGFDVLVLDGRAVVSRVRAGSPASDAGVKAGWILESVDRRLVRPRNGGAGASRLRILTVLRGAEGDSLDLVFLDEADRVVELSVGRWEEPGGTVAFEALGGTIARVRTEWVDVGSARRAGIVAWTMWSGSLMPQLHRTLDEMRTADGIVLDLRRNGGGFGAMVMGVAGHFFDSTVSLGDWRTREGALRFVVQPRRVTTGGRPRDAYRGPVAVLVDELTGSTSEVFAAGLQELGRARVFGRRTAGQVLPATVDRLPNGDRLLHAVADFTTPGGRRLEGRGVVPDEIVVPTRESLVGGGDPVLQAALRWIAEAAPSPGSASP